MIGSFMYYNGNYNLLPYHICFAFSKHTHVLNVSNPNPLEGSGAKCLTLFSTHPPIGSYS